MSVSVNKVATQLPFTIPSINQIIRDTRRASLGRSLDTLVALVEAGVMMKRFYIKSNKMHSTTKA